MVNHIEEESSSAVKLQLLTATMKLFFKRPAECQHTLGRLLEHAVGKCVMYSIRINLNVLWYISLYQYIVLSAVTKIRIFVIELYDTTLSLRITIRFCNIL